MSSFMLCVRFCLILLWDWILEQEQYVMSIATSEDKGSAWNYKVGKLGHHPAASDTDLCQDKDDYMALVFHWWAQLSLTYGGAHLLSNC